MLLLLYTVKATPAASSSDWTNAWTAVGTVALAIVTFATLIYTVITTRRDRRQAATDRAAADKRLEDDRKAADKRLKLTGDGLMVSEVKQHTLVSSCLCVTYIFSAGHYA